MPNRTTFQFVLVGVAAIAFVGLPAEHGCSAEEAPAQTDPDARKLSPPALSPEQWKQLDRAVDDGLKYLATQQQPDGSFQGHPLAQPALTSLGVLAFLSRGHVPEQGPHGKRIHSAVNFVLSTQQPNGLLFGVRRGPDFWSNAGIYNHAISGVMLCEVYGMTEAKQQEAIRKAIKKALEYTRSRQRPEKSSEHGGWRYLDNTDSDLSVTAWQTMFYRSARNAEFDVPELHINEAVAYVERCFDETKGSFFYNHDRSDEFSRGMAGAGILSLSLAGKHDTKMAHRAAQYILKHPFDRFNRGGLTIEDRYFYGAYYCSQGMYQLGGRNWEQFYAILLKTMAENQNADGSWDLEAHDDDQQISQVYTSAFAILSLTPPYQLLPIYQR